MVAPLAALDPLLGRLRATLRKRDRERRLQLIEAKQAQFFSSQKELERERIYRKMVSGEESARRYGFSNSKLERILF